MTRKRFDTQYYQVTEVNHNSQIGDSPHCVYVEMSTDEAWDLFERLSAHLRYAKPEEMFDLTFSCVLKRCGLWGMSLTPEEQERP